MSDLTCVGVDGITRSLDEHYHIQRDVEQDPYGAHKAIQDQAARIKELEEQVKELEAQLEEVKKRIGALDAFIDLLTNATGHG
jgi:peptidoglycan hydrolase CwlO-like protein